MKHVGKNGTIEWIESKTLWSDGTLHLQIASGYIRIFWTINARRPKVIRVVL